mmetsp:Transcript_115931/g.300570  ORF Transcript_115931/g.300570 Transcript_115931/m.300570 type:complete len:102 (+) Transcript_115931:11-316(+)
MQAVTPPKTDGALRIMVMLDGIPAHLHRCCQFLPCSAATKGGFVCPIANLWEETQLLDRRATGHSRLCEWSWRRRHVPILYYSYEVLKADFPFAFRVGLDN